MHISTRSATLIGFSAIAMWATLPVCAVFLKHVPPFQLTALAFSIAGAITIVKWVLAGDTLNAHLTLPPYIWCLGIVGIFGFHFFYFLALRLAPPVEVLLIDNLWPLMIVLLSAWINRERIATHHVLGCMLGLAGTVIITIQGKDVQFSDSYAAGYLAALACALIWAFYSVLSRKWSARIPRDAVGSYCIASALLAWVCHSALERWVALSLQDCLIILYAGLAPMGLSFFTWDVGMRRGDIRALGVLSYIGPLTGAVLLVAFGFSALTLPLGLAALLVLGGAFVGSYHTLKKPLTPP